MGISGLSFQLNLIAGPIFHHHPKLAKGNVFNSIQYQAQNKQMFLLLVWVIVYHVLPVSVWVSSAFSIFLPLPKDMAVGGLATISCP